MGPHSPGPRRDPRPASSDGGPVAPLPPLPGLSVDHDAVDPTAQTPPPPPTWSPLTVALPLFAVVWVCFGALAAAVTTPAASDVAALGRVLAAGAAVVALVLVTLAVAHLQVTGRLPRPAAGAVVALGLVQGLVAGLVGSGSNDMWGPGAWVFVLVGVAVPLAWVGGQFQSGVRRQRVERHESLTASYVERARREAHQTVLSVHRHDLRSMLFVVDGAARTLGDPNLSAEERRTFAEMLGESVVRLGELIDVRSEEIQSFAVDGVARAVVHAERRAGRKVTVEIASPLTAVGRAADLAAVLGTLIDVVGRKGAAGVQLLGEMTDGAVVIRVEPLGAEDLPLLSRNWEEIWVESFKPSRGLDDSLIDLFVATRLLAEQGADLWSSAGRARFAVRLPVGDSVTQEEA